MPAPAQPTGVEILQQIRQVEPQGRFLQSWDRHTRVLRFGCGDGAAGVQVGSDREITPSQPTRSTKLPTSTVQSFISGRTENSPLADVQAVLRRYLHFADERIYSLLSAWIAGTYLYSLFSHYGYVFLHSETPRCGKTRTEEITSHLAFEATTPCNAPTPPSMRETAVEGGTAIFDTLERWREKGTESYAAAMELLDAGFRNGGVVSKMVQTGSGEWRREQYAIYAPYMFAAIDKGSLTDTAIDRSFAIQMVRKSTRLRTATYDHARADAECQPLRERLYIAALTHARVVADAYDADDLAAAIHALGIDDRAADIWRPLLAITRAFGESHMTETLMSLAPEMSPDPDRQEEKRQLTILSALRTFVGVGGVYKGTTQQIIDGLEAITDVDCSDLHGLLEAWGFNERSCRLQGVDTPRKAWEIQDAALSAVENGINAGPTAPELVATTTTSVARPSWSGGAR
jgi:hypothetical protein